MSQSGNYYWKCVADVVFSSCVLTIFSLQYLNLESSFEGKDYVCDRLLQFLLTEASSGVSDKLSFQLMEALLYRVHLSLFTGRMESALVILQVRQQRNDAALDLFVKQSGLCYSAETTSQAKCGCLHSPQ